MPKAWKAPLRRWESQPLPRWLLPEIRLSTPRKDTHAYTQIHLRAHSISNPAFYPTRCLPGAAAACAKVLRDEGCSDEYIAAIAGAVAGAVATGGGGGGFTAPDQAIRIATLTLILTITLTLSGSGYPYRNGGSKGQWGFRRGPCSRRE